MGNRRTSFPLPSCAHSPSGSPSTSARLGLASPRTDRGTVRPASSKAQRGTAPQSLSHVDPSIERGSRSPRSLPANERGERSGWGAVQSGSALEEPQREQGHRHALPSAPSALVVRRSGGLRFSPPLLAHHPTRPLHLARYISPATSRPQRQTRTRFTPFASLHRPCGTFALRVRSSWRVWRVPVPAGGARRRACRAQRRPRQHEAGVGDVRLSHPTRRAIHPRVFRGPRAFASERAGRGACMTCMTCVTCVAPVTGVPAPEVLGNARRSRRLRHPDRSPPSTLAPAPRAVPAHAPAPAPARRASGRSSRRAYALHVRGQICILRIAP
jgi:hypothetical protein